MSVALCLALLLPGAYASSGGLEGGGVAGVVVGVVVFCALVLGIVWYIYYRPKQQARRKLEKWDDLPISACHKVDIADAPEIDCELAASPWVKVPGPERTPSSSSSIKLVPCTGYGQASPKKGNFIMRWIEEGLAVEAGNPDTACLPSLHQLSLKQTSRRLSRHHRAVSDSCLTGQRTTSERMERASLLASGADSARFPHDPWEGLDSFEEHDEDAKQSHAHSRWHTLSTRSESLPTPQQLRDYFKQDNPEGWNAEVHPSGITAQNHDNSREWHDAKSRGCEASGHDAQNPPFPNCVINPLATH